MLALKPTPLTASRTDRPDQAPAKKRKLVAHLLPASIKHDGPVPFAKRYWNPVRDGVGSADTVPEVKPDDGKDSAGGADEDELANKRDESEARSTKRRKSNDNPSLSSSPTSEQPPDSSRSKPVTSNTAATPQTAYFRGRRLRGREIILPRGYTGKLLCKTDALLPPPKPTAEQLRRLEARDGFGDGYGYGDDDEGEDGEGEEDDLLEPVEVRLLEEQGCFDRVVVWGHEALPDPTSDVYVRGLSEWIGFAEAVSLTCYFLCLVV